VGVLVAPERASVRPIIHGGGQQHRRRSGTEDLPGIIGLVRAVELAEEERAHEVARLTRLRETLLTRLRTGIPDLILHGHPTMRLPGNLHIGIPGIEAEVLVLRLDREGVYVASGAACTTPMVEPSHVLASLGLPPDMIRSGIRLSLGRTIGDADVERAADIIVRVVHELRA
jgi:cysteine desulfurase